MKVKQKDSMIKRRKDLVIMKAKLKDSMIKRRKDSVIKRLRLNYCSTTFVILKKTHLHYLLMKAILTSH